MPSDLRQALRRQLQEDPGARANLVGLAVNVGLAVGKFTIGALTGSAALIADGFNSAGDIVATAIAYVGYTVAQEPPDENHHYGHGNAETVAGLIVGGTLLATGIFISIDGFMELLAGSEQAPGPLALAMAGLTMLVKEALYRYTIAVGRRLNSPALLASSRDHRADVFVGLAVFAGVGGAQLGLPWLDPVAAVGIGLYIAWMAFEPIRDNVGVLMDEADPELAERIRWVARSVEGVREVDSVRVHPLGSYFMVDMEIYVDGQLSLHDAHDLCHAVSARVCAEVEHVRDVRVHVNPTGTRAE
ncbi:MAG: cation transporter [Alphaproteobacteria bacterium]|nr:cation transporter [Alphaproteobacteria bacterium]